MQKIYSIVFSFFIISSIEAVKEHNALHPLRPTHFVTHRGFERSSDLSDHFYYMDKFSFIPDFYLKHPEFLKIENRQTDEYVELLLEHVISYAKDGDIISIRNGNLAIFFEKIVPKLTKKIILVTGEDETFPEGYPFIHNPFWEEALGSENILHLFITNNNYQGKYKHKVSTLPIGLNYHSGILNRGLPAGQERVLKKIILNLPKTSEREWRKICCDFGLNNNGGERFYLKELLLSKGIADVLKHRIPRDLLWKIKGQKAFDVSPKGWGQDCYRTWEALALGCIVIVKTSFLDPLYEGLPVVIVQDWNEITEENLQKWLIEYGDVLHNTQMRERLTHKYWMDKIRKVQSDYRKSLKKAAESKA